MDTRHITVALLILASLSTTTDLHAQRRGTDSGGSGSGGRSTPSGGGSRSGGGGGGGESRRGGGSSSGGSRSGGEHSGGSSGGSSSGGSSSGAKPAGSDHRPDGGSTAQGGQGSGSSQPSAQAERRPTTGKISRVRSNARAVQARTRSHGGVVYGGGVYVSGCYGCYGWGWYGTRWGWWDGGWWYPGRHPYHDGEPYDYGQSEGGTPPDEQPDEAEHQGGQGYLDYPYADVAESDETFVRSHTPDERHGYGALSGYYFKDKGSTTESGHVMLEGATGMLRGEAEYGQYREPLSNSISVMHTGRAAIGIQPALGPRAYLTAVIGARGLWLDDGSDAYGPEGSLGLQLLPFKPIGINVTGRIASMTWTGQDHFMLSEVNTTGSIFLGRLELQGGWHWMKLEGSPAFGGPMVGTRIWF